MSAPDLLMREAAEEDLPALAEISRLTWEGDDYLADVASGWIREGGFFVGVSDGEVAGCVRMAALPGPIIWLEGLRVHPGKRGRGYGRAMSEFVVSRARRMLAEGLGRWVEFATYYRNSESIGITTAQGFSEVERFFVVSRGNASGMRGVAVRGFRRGWTGCYRMHVPCGWRLPIACPDAEPWLEERCSAWDFDGAGFYGRKGRGEFALLQSGMDRPSRASEGICRAACRLGLTGGFDVILPESRPDVLEAFLAEGWSFWDEPAAPNLLVFRLSAGD